MSNQENRKTNRRNFLKIAGTGAAATAAVSVSVSTTAFYGCKPENQSQSAGGINSEKIPAGKMTYRTNHLTGDKVSLLGYGCMRLPLKQKVDGSGEEVDQKTVNELVDYAIAHGVNYFDTAPVYIRGWAETATGIALKRHSRDKFFIATKMSNFSDPSRSASIAMYNNSFKALQVDYFDYYLMHNIGPGEGLATFRKRFIDNGILDFLVEERKAGRIRNLGWSFHGNVEVFDYVLAMGISWDFVQIQLNYQDWQHAAERTNAENQRNINAEYLYGELVKRNIPATIMEPLLGGRLSRVPLRALSLMKELHAESTPAQWAFRYAGTPDNILTVLSGMVCMEHLQENVRTYSPLVPLNEQEYRTLEKITAILVDAAYIQCTGCQYCMPCPYGLDIPNIFAHYNRCVTEGNLPQNPQDKNYRRASRVFLTGLARDIAKERQPNHCIGCALCAEKCPQKIPIPENMERIDKLIEQLKQKTV
jgi:predicted aldo/keto reductase-like oxidoreductase